MDRKVFVGNHKGAHVFVWGADSVTNGPAVQPTGDNDGQEGHADASKDDVNEEGNDEGR